MTGSASTASDTTQAETGATGATNVPTEAAADPTSTTAETSSTGGVVMCSDAVDDCCCFTSVPDPGTPKYASLVVACPIEAPACTFKFECDDFDICAMPIADDPAALTCALTALRDRTVGRVTWTALTMFMETEGRELFVQADGTAFTYETYFSDTPEFSYSGFRRIAIQPAAYFDDCLALTTDAERFACLLGFEASELEVCLEPFTDW